MADGDHYAAYADVQALLMNSGVGTSGNTMFDDTALEAALDITQAIINIYIYGDDTTTKVAGSYAQIAKGIQINLVRMMVLGARHMQENNLADIGGIMSFWQITPSLTYADKKLLDMIKQNVVGVAFNYNTQDGSEIP